MTCEDVTRKLMKMEQVIDRSLLLVMTQMRRKIM